MNSHFDLSDQKFEELFAQCALDSSLFTHEAHVRLVWVYIKRYGIEEAEKRIPRQLKNYVESLGATEKYNETLTIAAIKMIYVFMCKSLSQNFKDFVKEFPDLVQNFKALVQRHYSFDVFHSAKAKREYLEPDLYPFI